MSRADDSSLELRVLRELNAVGTLTSGGPPDKLHEFVNDETNREAVDTEFEHLLTAGFVKIARQGVGQSKIGNEGGRTAYHEFPYVVYEITEAGRQRLQALEAQSEQAGESQGGGPSIRIS